MLYLRHLRLLLIALPYINPARAESPSAIGTLDFAQSSPYLLFIGCCRISQGHSKLGYHAGESLAGSTSPKS